MGRVHDSDDALLGAHIIREYLDHFKMDYTQSVYMPEVALQHSKSFKDLSNKQELARKVGVHLEGGEAVMVMMIRQMK